MIKKLTFDTIYHEHMSYHSLKPLLNFFKNIDLEIVDFDLIEAQGGSIRVYVGHKGRKINSTKITKQIILKKIRIIFNKTFQKYFKRIMLQKIKYKI